MSVRIDILLATYQGAAFLPEQLASLEAQTHRDWRLFLRDDGSTDGSPALVRDWAARHGRTLIEIVDGDSRTGPCESFSRLLAASDGPWFAFCDQDDFWAPEKLEILLAAAQAAGDEGPVMAHCDLEVVGRGLEPLAPSFWARAMNDPDLRGAAPGHRHRLFYQNPATGCAMLGNAALREAMAPVPRGVRMHDWWATLTAAWRGRIVAVDRPLVRYRQHGGNTIGARKVNSVAMMAWLLLTEREAALQRTRDVMGGIEVQAAAAERRLAPLLTAKEAAFARGFAGMGAGLRRGSSWRILLWALAARRRWPLAAHLLIRTFSRPAAPPGPEGSPRP